MAVAYEEVHMANGRWSVDVDYDAALYDRLTDRFGNPLHLHCYLYKGAALQEILLLQRVTPSVEGMTLSGTSVLWWLGTAGGDGPVIRDRTYVSGNNKLDNGDFSSSGAGLSSRTVPKWKSDQTSNWFYEGYETGWSTPGRVRVFGDGLVDDPLVSEGLFSVADAQQYRATAYVMGGSGAGRIRLRVVFDAATDFGPPNLLTQGDFETSTLWSESSDTLGDAIIVNDPSTAHSGNSHLKMRTTMFSPHANGDFDTGLSGWYQTVAAVWSSTTAQHWGPTSSAQAQSTTGAKSQLIMDAVPATGTFVDYFPVVPGEVWRFQGAMLAGSATLAPNADARLRMICALSFASSYSSTDVPVGDITPGQTAWVIHFQDITIPDECNAISPRVEVEGQTTGRFYVGGQYLLRLRGNRATFGHSTWQIQPGRSYTLRAWIHSDGVKMQGYAWPKFVFSDYLLNNNVTVEGRRQGVSADWTMYETTVTAPSGSYYVTMTWVAEDVYGGWFHIDDCSFRDADTKTLWYDVVSQPNAATWTAITQDVTVPTGAKTVHVEVVAEAHSNGWYVDDVSLKRIDKAPETIGSVLSSLMLDPDTGAALSLSAVVAAPGNGLPYDWTIRNMNVRDGVEHFCRVVASPQLEWKLNSPGMSMDFNVAASLFTDHAPSSPTPIVYLSSDIYVEDIPAQERSSEEVLSKVIVLGADRVSTSGLPTAVEGTAPNTFLFDSGDVDFNGRQINRARLVQDSAVEYPGYAKALAADVARRAAVPAAAITVSLSGDVDRGAVPGDWVYAYRPESGLRSDLYPTTVSGEDVFPARKRVMTRFRNFSKGAGYSISVRTTSGTFFDLTGIKWSDADTTTMELVDFIPTFQSDPQGGEVSRQFTRFALSQPR